MAVRKSAPPVLVIHEENKSVRVLGEVAGADVLPVAAEICEGKRLLVDDAEEAGRSATMLDIGLPVLARGGDIEGAHARDELREVRINGGAESALCLHALVALARAASLLHGPDRRRERDV